MRATRIAMGEQPGQRHQPLRALSQKSTELDKSFETVAASRMGVKRWPID